MTPPFPAISYACIDDLTPIKEWLANLERTNIEIEKFNHSVADEIGKESADLAACVYRVYERKGDWIRISWKVSDYCDNVGDDAYQLSETRFFFYLLQNPNPNALYYMARYCPDILIAALASIFLAGLSLAAACKKKRRGAL